MKKTLALLLCACLCATILTGCVQTTFPAAQQPAQAQAAEVEAAEEKASETLTFTTKWDLTQIYADQAAFDADYAAAEAFVPKFEALRGSLSTPEGMLAYLKLKYELAPYISRMQCYASFQTTLDVKNADAKNLSARLSVLSTKLSQAQSFVDSEHAAMTLEERTALANAPELAEYAHNLEDLADEKTLYLTEEANNVLAQLGNALYTADNVYTTLLYGDMPYPTYTMPDGETVKLDDNTFSTLVYDRTPREQLIEMTKLRAKTYKPYENTFAACLDAHMRTTWDIAQLNNYDTTMEYELSLFDVEPGVYSMLIDAAHNSATHHQRYYNAMKNALGLAGADMYGFDTYLPATDFVPQKTYEESAADVLSALSILGPEYQEGLRAMLTSGHIDAFPADNKDTGAYSSEIDGKIYPYIMMNYVTASDARTLAHELGHSLYNMYSAAYQPLHYASPNIFTHEVTSFTNELLYCRTMYDKAQSDDERLFYLQKQIERFDNAFFTQMLFAEFEDFCYKKVESGGTLSAAELDAEYARLKALYDGGVFATSEGSEAGWCAIPHFYYNYYVYQYASSMCYASAVADRIYNGDEGALENYLSFLKLGASVAPIDALAVAGVDPLAQSTYDDAMAYYSKLIDQYSELVAK